MKNKFLFKTIKVMVMLFFVSFSSYSQTDYTHQHNQHEQLSNELNGAFQIQMIGIRTKPMIDTELLQRIKAEQKASEETSFYHRDNIRIIIKSKEEVSSGNLFTYEESITYINE